MWTKGTTLQAVIHATLATGLAATVHRVATPLCGELWAAILAIALALLSHPLLDAFNHVDLWIFRRRMLNGQWSGDRSQPPLKWEMPVYALDVILGFLISAGLGYWLYPEQQLTVTLAGWVAVVPDFAYAPVIGSFIRNSPITKWFHDWHEAIHYPIKADELHRQWQAPAIVTVFSIGLHVLLSR